MKHVVKRSLSLLLVLLLCLQLIPLTGGHVHAEDAEELEHSEEYYELRECPFCGKIREVGDTICRYCHACCDDNGCYYDSASHCKACDRCAEQGAEICLECSLCDACLTQGGNHCEYCMRHLDASECNDCTAAGHTYCEDCHDLGFDGQWSSGLYCDGCETCLYALFLTGEFVCNQGNGLAHCAKCDEDWICDECGGCFYGLDFDFCATCQLCIACATQLTTHCSLCMQCFEEVEMCGNDWSVGRCEADCPDENHCEICGQHIVDNDWCPQGGFGTHCAACMEVNFSCGQCGTCIKCEDLDICEDCGLCKVCCLQNSEAAGCDCGLCVESEDFSEAEHLCENCEEVFSCAEGGFCEDCGLCADCCREASESAGCSCGLCVESNEWEDHFCQLCDTAFCVNGDPCEFCGLCPDCCMSISESEGCECGLCVESDDFLDSDHLCEACGRAFSCVDSFCDTCRYCLDCCRAAAEELGCNHDFCVEDSSFLDHYCESCESCKEDCSCGQDCCLVDGMDCRCCDACEASSHCSCGCGSCGCAGLYEGYRFGDVFSQPGDRSCTVSTADLQNQGENLVSFRVHAVGEKTGRLHFQWYQRIGQSGTATPLTNREVYSERYDETFTLTDGVTTPSLTISVPRDACSQEYYYFCVVTDEEGTELSRSREARLKGRHITAWKPIVLDGRSVHAMACTAPGCSFYYNNSRYPAQDHNPGPWKLVRYASESSPGLRVRSCVTCGTRMESEETSQLYNHTVHTYEWYEIRDVYKFEEVIFRGDPENYHIAMCVCGKTKGHPENHIYGAWQVESQATEIQEGRKYHDCLACGYRQYFTIKKQTHAHQYDWSWSADTTLAGANNRYHWQECLGTDCAAVAGKGVHQFGSWTAISYAGPNTEGVVYRACEACGYQQDKQTPAGRYQLLAYNGTTLVRAVVIDPSRDPIDIPIRAKVPDGYRFTAWESLCTGDYTIEFKDPGSPDTTMKVIRDLHASEKRDSYAPIVVEAKLERLDNYLLVDYMGKTLKVYPNQGILRKDTGIKKAGEVIDAAKGDYDLALFVDDSHEDIYGMRTLTVYLNNYNGGRITLYSRGLPCNLEVVCEGTVNCISSGEYGILGNNDGGYVRVSSEDESSLYISVSDTWNDPTGICSRSEKSWIDEEVILAGNVDVHITSTATYPNSQAYGLYSSKRVSVLDDASLQVDCLHTSSQVTRKTAATAIYAKRQAEINTQGSVNLNTYQLKDQNALGIPVQSTNFLINGASRLNFIYPARQNKAWRADLVMDESEYILHEYKKEMKKLSGAAYNTCVLELEPGYRVQLSPYFKDDVILQQLTDWREENGVYMVPAGEEFRFTLTPITSEAYTMKGECSINNAPIDYISTEDGVTYEYSIPSVREDSYITQHVSHFSGFDSSPFPASQTVKTGTEFQYSWTIRPADATAMWWQKKVSPTTDTKVHLQRLDAELGWVECGSADLTDSGSATYLEKTPFAEGDTTVYRLALRFNNREFTSGEFKVTWTEDPTLSRVPSVNAVEVYTRLATSPLYREQAAWLRLDSKTPRLVFDGRYGTYRTAKKNEGSLEAKLISIAVLDPDTGTLTLKGDSVTGTIDGVKRTLDCSEILGAIRVPEADSVHGATALGRLKLVLQGDTTLSMDYNEAFWMISTAGNASREDTEAAILTNRYGDILITSDAPACLNIWNRADEEGITQNGKWYGRTIYGIQGYETVTVSGNTMVSIDLQGDYIGGNNKALTRVGISGNSIVLEDKANLSIDLPGLEARGGTVGLEGGSGDILLKGQSHLNITADGTPTNVAAESRYYGIQTDGCFRMEGNSSLYLSVTGDWVTGIQANDGISLQSEGAAIVDAYNNGPYGGHGVALQSNGDLNLDNGGRVVLFYDVENGSLWEASVPALYEDDHVCYEEISQRKGSLKILSGKGADLTIHSDESDETEKPLISVSPQENLTAILLSGYELSVRAGDTVKVTMPSDTGIYTFRGWEAEGTLPADWKAEDRSVSFTMPAEGLELKPILTCELFPNQPYLLQEDNSETGRLWWSAAHNINQYWLFAVKLQKWVYNWYDQEWGWQDQFDLLEADMDSSGSETAPVCGWIQVSRSGQRALEDGEYRLAAVMKDGDSFKTYPGQSFELNWGQTSAFTAAAGCSTADTASYLSHGRGDVHVALAGLDIPAGYVGEDYSVDVSSLLRPVGTAFRYEASLRDSSSSLSQTGIVDFSITEDGRLYLYRRAAHDAIQASAGTCVVTATDLFTGAKIHMYFSLGEIRARSLKDYGLFVAGTCVNEYNKDDVLGDGTVSYNPLTHTLTLKEADLNGAYAVQGESFAAACGIYSQMGGTLTIRLEGSNTITVTNSSPCCGMNYSIRGLDKLGIGSFRSTRFSTSPDSILIEGSGTLNIQVPENNSCGIYATSVYLKSGSVSIHSGMTGICATYGAVENSGAKLQVMSTAAGIEVLDGVPTYGISLNKGDVTIEAGSYALASYGGQKIYLWNDHIVLKAKNPDGQVALGEITSAVDGLIELQKTPGGDKTLWNGTDSLSDAVSLETDSYFPVAVNGQRFRYNQRTIACESGSATYKPDSHTLVLSNAEITDSTEVTPGNPAAIYVKGSTALTIRLEGENSIRLKSVPYPKESYGLYGSSLSLSGDGSLTISKAVKGIRATEQLTVSGGHTSIEATQQAVYTPELKVRGGILEANNTLNAWLDFGVNPSEEPVAIYTGSCAEDAEFYNYAALGHPDADYILLEGAYPAAVNGIPFSAGHLTIPCGQGSAVYDPALNTITLTNAQITQGCSLVQGGDTLFTGLYVKDHAYLRLVGDSRIDISGSESPVYGAAGADETDFASSLAGTGSVEIYGNGKLTMTAPDGIKLEASASAPGTLTMRGGCVESRAGSYANRLAQLDYHGGSLTLTSAVKDAEVFRVRDLAPSDSYTLTYSANPDGSQNQTGTLADISGKNVPYLVITGTSLRYTLMDVSRLFRYLTGTVELTEDDKHFLDCDGNGTLALKDVYTMFHLVSR